MKIRINKNFDLREYVNIEKKKIMKAVTKEAQKEGPQLIIDKALKSIRRGNSPVEGYARFEKYSKSHIDQMGKGSLANKKQRPINMTVSGKMLRSLISRVTQNGFVVYFTSKLAKFHNEGDSKLPQRKIFPVEKEAWSEEVAKPFKRLLESILSKYIKRS